jgi:co-chaperonin GroES (HSP10)
MKVLRHFVVEVLEKHEDTIKLGEKELYLDTRFNEFDHRVCHGSVVSAPFLIDTGVKEGDTLFFHHHVTTNPSLSLGDNKYIVVYDQEHSRASHAIAYRDSEGELSMLSGWVFVQPPEKETEEEVTDSGIIVNLKTEEVDDKTAIVVMPHPQLIEQGVEIGDVVGFDVGSDYKMKLDDDSIVYRMRLEDLSYVVKE